jgi:pimeloyl-ACP methyl ester carboxylesterase
MEDVVSELAFVEVGTGAESRRIAMLVRAGRAPGIFWLGGYRSDMTGSKAGALDDLGAELGLAVTRFDYSGHGQSGGDFLDGTISRWLEEALAVFALTEGPQVVVGSSMGGWLALLLAKTLAVRNPGRVKALTLIAPAVDMTEDLMLKGFSKKELKAAVRARHRCRLSGDDPAGRQGPRRAPRPCAEAGPAPLDRPGDLHPRPRWRPPPEPTGGP